MVQTEIKVFTLNCWGIPVISSDRLHRMEAIAEVLSRGEYDLMCLQEVWAQSDYFFLKNALSSVIPYSYYFYSGVLGSGLCVFSKYPVSDVFFHQWPVNGYVHKVQHGDWFGGKGIGLCRIKMQDLSIHLYTAHLHAEYDHHNDEYLAHRVLQAFDTAQFIRLTSGNSDLVILGGDLNTEPNDLSYRILCHESGLEDTFYYSDKISDECVGTNESARNSYSNKDNLKTCPGGKRIDYVLFQAHPNIQMENVHYELPLPERVPHCNFSYSDHEAVGVTLKFHKTSEEIPFNEKKVNIENHEHALLEGLKVCNEALEKLNRARYFYSVVTCGLLLVLLSILSTSPPYDMHGLYKLTLAVVSAAVCFTAFMSSLWNRMEINGIMSGKVAMEVSVGKLKKSSNEHTCSEQFSE